MCHCPIAALLAGALARVCVCVCDGGRGCRRRGRAGKVSGIFFCLDSVWPIGTVVHSKIGLPPKMW